ncbi:MAG: aminoacetone oxidase family FAD-binding enzyme [Campylobacter sp.]|nr:aminoacetone oxidase family FAD-binding enzyme [Campylobacter sp.]
MIKIYDILVLGGGVSALALGAFLNANCEKSVAIIEKNPRLALKLLASGGGKCNITNEFISVDNYLGGEEILQNLLSEFDYKFILDFFSDLEFMKLKNSQFFCKSGSKSVLNSLLKLNQKSEIFLDCEVKSAKKDEEIFRVFTSKGEFWGRNLVVATGSLSYPALGASGVGHEIAKSFNHSITPIKPALVGLTLQKDEFWMKSLSGVSLPCKVSVMSKNPSKKPRNWAKFSPNLRVKEIFGDMLFTHKEISGPAILNASLFWEKGSLEIDFLPNFNPKFINPNRQLSSNLPLPRSFIRAFLEHFDIEDKPFNKFSQDELIKLKSLRAYKLAPAGTFGLSRAEICKGGVSSDEVDESFASKFELNLYFIGEVLDIAGMLGGYNIHFGIASAIKAGQNLAR